MKQEVSLTGTNTNPDGSIEVNYAWNGTPGVIVYSSAEALRQANADLLIAPDEAVRWLMFYLLNLGATPDALAAWIGKTLTLDVAASVQQVVSVS